jgi:uncharacterized protein RhaS with RHS repeats
MKTSIPLVLFLVGVLSFLLVFVLPHEGRPLVVLGGVTWVAAYFCVLADNYKRRAPVHTRGGLLRYEEKPSTYRFVYGLLVFLGVLSVCASRAEYFPPIKGARYYNSQLGRFISEDPFGFAGGINLYAYVDDNPISFRDPFGVCPATRNQRLKLAAKGVSD